MQNETWDFNTSGESVVGPTLSSTIQQTAKVAKPFYRLAGGNDSNCCSLNEREVVSQGNLRSFGSLVGGKLLRSQDKIAGIGLLELRGKNKDGCSYGERERNGSNGNIGGRSKSGQEKSNGVMPKSLVYNDVDLRGLLSIVKTDMLKATNNTSPTGMYWPSKDEFGVEKVLGTFNPKKELECRKESATEDIQGRGASNGARRRVSIRHSLTTMVSGTETNHSAPNLPKRDSRGSWSGNNHYQPLLQTNIHSAMQQGCWSNPSLEDLMRDVHKQKREQREKWELEKRSMMAKEQMLHRRGSEPVTFHDSGWRFKETEAALAEEQ
uniref:Uncharacterized protein n=1 Tax=Odontella aurita TaxID=265563 RepID=A0A7S4NCK4_9STRA|mmetsp:Transcript_57773/g.172441  ORF Transcript_57773/g.172441 Transcript_57773/m.172441 type:complete len:323 (+) Transcript_57773:205-1173(+)